MAYTGVHCAEDPKFESDHGAEFYQRAKQYGVPVVALWYGNMVQVGPDGSCKRIGYIGGPGGQPTYDLAKQFLLNLGTQYAFWGARQPEGGWLFYAPPNYIGPEPPPGFQTPGPVPSPTATSAYTPPIAPYGPTGVYPAGTYPGQVAQAGMLGRMDPTTMLLLVGGAFLLLSSRRK